MLSVCIAEDEEIFRRQLCDFLRRYAMQTRQQIYVDDYCDGDELMQHYRIGCDIVLLDIEMNLLNGLETAQKIREIDESVTILFITNAPQYAMRGYEVRAFDYVLKPVTYDVFVQHFERAVRALEKRQKPQQHISIPVQSNLRRIDTDTITYAEVRDHTLIVHTTSGDVIRRGTISKLERELDPSVFFRCHKMFLVNLDFVDGVQGSEISVAGDTILVSRARRRQFLDALNERMSVVGI
ncbi:LytR/AlgR family response regulator transcription factor [Alloscardovia omnicolens]|uniref:LytR/AlgR family response regulator transcription factor n=1 Tax=Alloscardovia omnicolens TaxID=419015 RepID=UPI003A738571